MSMPFQFDDGGRAAAGFRGETGDCVTRAIAIATGRKYGHVYEAINLQARFSERGRKRSSARTGVFTKKGWFKAYMEHLGFRWTPTMQIGTGCQVHLRPGELPAGRLVVSCSRHFTAVINGTIHDTFNPARDGTRCVYGFWKLKE